MMSRLTGCDSPAWESRGNSIQLVYRSQYTHIFPLVVELFQYLPIVDFLYSAASSGLNDDLGIRSISSQQPPSDIMSGIASSWVILHPLGQFKFYNTPAVEKEPRVPSNSGPETCVSGNWVGDAYISRLPAQAPAGEKCNREAWTPPGFLFWALAGTPRGPFPARCSLSEFGRLVVLVH